MRIDLILLDQPGGVVRWPVGEQAAVTASAVAVADAACKSVGDGADALLHWSASLGPPDHERAHELLLEPDDVWHGGLHLGLAGMPRAIDDVAATWMLNRDPDPDADATSWRLSLRACLVRASVITSLGHADGDFDSLDAAGLELGHRWINHGARMRHVADLVPVEHHAAADVLSRADELRFIERRYGRKWMAWSACCHASRPLSTLRAAQAAAKRTPETATSPPRNDLRPAELPAALAPGKVTVLIPTVERYGSLQVVLGQLRSQTVPPHQVVVIDQTPTADRRPELIASFDDLPLTALTLEEAGQSSARNAGLEAATGDYVLFIDDDDEIEDDLIELHLRAIADRDVEVSSGVVHEPGNPELSDEFRRFRVSDTFPTNNSMVRRSALESSGWFDLAYDRGDRADHDLGMRLYLSGARMVMDPQIDLVHNHAPRGGLRVHNARAVTYARSRASIGLRQGISPTQLYLWHRYFRPDQVRMAVRLHLAAGLFGTGPRWRQVARAAVQAVSLPLARREVAASEKLAAQLRLTNPRIPHAPAAMSL